MRRIGLIVVPLVDLCIAVVVVHQTGSVLQQVDKVSSGRAVHDIVHINGQSSLLTTTREIDQ